MGNITVMIVRNDALGEIETNPEEFVRNLIDALRRPGVASEGIDVSVGGFANAATTLRRTPSSIPVAVVTDGMDVDKHRAVENLADEIGCVLCKDYDCASRPRVFDGHTSFQAPEYTEDSFKSAAELRRK